jgi:hypothetical protein
MLYICPKINIKKMNIRWIFSLLLFSVSLYCTCYAQQQPTPVIHLTDLYHPHGDPDDHFDLACLYSLAAQGKIEIKGVGLDYPPNFRKGDPDLTAVAQLNYICGLDVPAFIGSAKLLQTKTDTLPGLAQQNATGINRIIRILRESDEPVAIIVVGSATDVAVAALREPELFRTKCAGIYLNSGATHQNEPDQLEFNVNLNPAAYAALFSLPCPLYWFPCWNVCEERVSGEWGSFYWLQHTDAFDGISVPLQTYFYRMFSQSKEPNWLRSLKTAPPEDKWNEILKDRRGMWSTASILMTAGLTVTRTGEIVSIDSAGDRALFRMEYVDVQCEDNGRLQWNLTDKPTNCRLLHVLDAEAYPAAMSKAVNALLRVLQ